MFFFEIFREEETEKKKKSRNSKIKRYALIGIATVSGGALIGKFLRRYRYTVGSSQVTLPTFRSYGDGSHMTDSTLTTISWNCHIRAWILTLFIRKRYLNSQLIKLEIIKKIRF